MSTNVDNRLLKSNDTSTGMSLKSALGLEQEQEQSRPASMNKAATANYLSSLRREQDEVGDNLSRSMNKLNQSLSQAAAKSDTAPVDEQAQKMAVYSKLAGKLIDRDSSLQEKVAQNLSSNSNVVRSKDASESLQKAMDNLPPALKEGTQAGKDLAKFMVENLVTLSDRKQMGAGLERDLAVRQISIPKNQPNSRIQQASSKVLSASIEYVKNNQPEVLAKIPPETKAESQTSSTTTIKAQEHSAPAQTKDTTYISALKAQRHQSAINNDQEPKAQAPQDKISAEISKRIHSLIAQAATTAKSGNLISLSPEEAERFDRTQSPQSSDNLKRIFGQNNNSSSNTSSVNNGADEELPPPSTTNKQAPTNVRQLSLAELSARANQLQTQFREERQRIVQEGKLPDPAQMPEYTFDKASVKATLTQAHIQQQQQEQQRAQQTSSLYESLARARSAISAHSSQYANQTQQAEQPAPQQQQPAQPQTTEQKQVVQDNKAPAAQQPAQPQTTEQKPVAQDNKAPAAQQPAQPQTTEQKPVVQDNKAPAVQQQPTQSQTTEQKPVVQDNKAPAAQQQPAQPQTTEQKPVAQDNKTPATQQPTQSQTTEQKPAVQDNKAPAAQQPAQPQTTEQKPVAQDNKAPATQQPAQSQTTEQKPVAQDNKAPAAQQPAQPQTTEQKPSNIELNHSSLNLGKTDVNLSFNAIQSSTYGGMDIMPGMTIPVSHFGQFDNDTIQPNNKALEALKVQARLLESQLKSAEQELAQLKQNATLESKPTLNTSQPVTNGDEQQLSSGSNVANKPSIVPNTEVPKGTSGVPVTDGDEQQLSSGSNVANKPIIVPNTEVPKGPSGVPVADGDEQQLSSGSNVANKPSIVPNTEVPKGPSGVPVANGDEQQLSSGSNVANKPSIVPNTEVPKGPSGVPVADGDESVVEQKVDTVVKPPVMTTEQPVNSNNNLAGAGAPTVEHSNRTNPFAKLYGVMQQGHYDEANIQQPNLNDKGNSSNTLGFNTALAKPMDGNSQSSQTQSNSNQYVPSGSGSMMSEASDEAQFSNNTIIVKGPVDAEAASEEPSITDKPNHVTNASATDVSKTKEFLAQNAQEKEAVVQEKQATKEALEQNIKENKQEQKIQEEQVVQEEFVATMQARAQSTQQAIEQAQIQANLQAQQVQSNQQLANGKLYENGQINQFSRLYQQTISEQNAQQTRVLGSSQVNTVGDTNIKATGATIATTTTNINVETQEQGQQNTGATNLANRNTVGHTTVDQSNRLLGGDQSAVSANQLNQGAQAQGQAQAQNLANNPSAGAQNTATQGSQAQAQVSTTAQVQGQPQAQAQTQPQAQVQGQAQAPVQGQAQAPVQGQAQVQTNVPNSNVQSQAVQPNVGVGAVSGTGAVSQMQAQVQVQVQTQAQAQAQAQIQAQIQANGNAIQMPNGLSTPVVNLDEDSLQDEIIKNVMQTVPSDDLDEFGIKNNNNLTSAPLSGVVADTDLTEDNNTFSQILNKGATEPNALSALGDSSKVVPTNSALGAAQITSGQNDPIPEESVVNNVATPKEGGILRRLASLFGRKNNVEEAVSSSSNDSKSVDPSKAALDNLLNKSEQTASSQNSAATNIRMNSYESLVNKLQMAAADEALPPKMQEQAQNLLKSLQNPVNDLKTVSSWLNFVTGPMSPSSSQALALHQWAFMLLCIRFEQIGKNVEKFLKKTQGGTDKIAKLDTAIKDSAKVAQELDDVTVSKSHDLLKETFSQVERMQQQMQSIPQDQSVLRYIPLPPNYQGGKEGSFSAQKRKDEDGGTSWHLNFNLDLQDMGALQVKVKLRFPEIQMSFVAEKFETLQKVQQHMPELNAKLKEIGLTSTGSNARLGHINFNQDQAPSPSNNGSKFKYEGNAFNVDA